MQGNGLPHPILKDYINTTFSSKTLCCLRAYFSMVLTISVRRLLTISICLAMAAM